jgi:hypothetical protein
MSDPTPKTESLHGGSKSAVLHPYFDLKDSIEVAKAVHDRGGGQCARDLVAAALGYSTTKSGAFLSRLSAAKQFGLIRTNGDIVSTSEASVAILHPVMESEEVSARRDAFLSVPLFQKVYERFKGGSLPQEAGLMNLFKSEFKISDERLKPAVRVMMASAEQAGFFIAGGRTRLIAPGGSQSVVPKSEPSKIELNEAPTDRAKTAPSSIPEGSANVHPALIAMLRELPRSGTEWPKAKKNLFMAAFRSIVDVVYPDPKEET